jgi:hypothetical protein
MHAFIQNCFFSPWFFRSRCPVLRKIPWLLFPDPGLTLVYYYSPCFWKMVLEMVLHILNIQL